MTQLYDRLNLVMTQGGNTRACSKQGSTSYRSIQIHYASMKLRLIKPLQCFLKGGGRVEWAKLDNSDSTRVIFVYSPSRTFYMILTAENGPPISIHWRVDVVYGSIV
jgi:hypothetical protein